MDDRDKIEEAHGLWELAIVRLATIVEAGLKCKVALPDEMVAAAVADERAAFKRWQEVSCYATGATP